MSKLDLRCINFKYAKMKGCQLLGANLSKCNMERVDLSNAKLDAAQLLGVRMVCSNLEKASLQNCNFEDPAGSVALMEGWLKHDEIMMRFVLRIIIRSDLTGGAGGALCHSGANHALTLHRIIEINLSFPMESNCGFGS